MMRTRRFSCCERAQREIVMAAMGSVPSFRALSSSDRFQEPNVREPGHAAEMLEASASREWLLAERGSSSARCAAARLIGAHCGSGQIALHALAALKLAASPRIHCCVAEANAAIQTECSNFERMNSQTTILAAVRLFCQPGRDSLAALSMRRVSTLSQYAFDRAAMCSARSPSSHRRFNKRL